MYYKDVLIAAYMARVFEIKFEPWVFDKEMHMPDGATYKYKESRKITYEILLKDVDQKKSPYCIHPDCYKIFKPQAGDLISGMLINTDKTIYMNIYALPYATYDDNPAFSIQPFKRSGSRNFKKDTVRIIQRNGKAFFMPEVA